MLDGVVVVLVKVFCYSYCLETSKAAIFVFHRQIGSLVWFLLRYVLFFVGFLMLKNLQLDQIAVF